MASRNVAAVRRVIDLYMRMDRDAAARRGSAELEELLAHFASDVELVQSAALPGAASHQGHRGLERSWADWLSAWDDFRTEIEEIRERGDHVLVLTHDRFVGRDGVEVENHGGSIYTLRDGLIVRLELFVDQDGARRRFEAEGQPAHG